MSHGEVQEQSRGGQGSDYLTFYKFVHNSLGFYDLGLVPDPDKYENSVARVLLAGHFWNIYFFMFAYLYQVNE